MFLLDDILFAPLKGLVAVCQKVHEAAEEDLESQEKAVTGALAELYQLLETQRIGDEEFNVRENELLDRLDAVHNAREPAGGLD